MFQKDMRKAHKILVVDDNPDDREIMRMVLNDMGRKEELEFLPSGAVALQRLRSGYELPSLIFIDIKLPSMNGIYILRQIKADECLYKIPVIIVSGSSNPKDEKEVMEAGADGFVYKNFDVNQLSCDISCILQHFFGVLADTNSLTWTVPNILPQKS